MHRGRMWLIFCILALVPADLAWAALPPGWSSQDINSSGGYASESSGTWTISGNGEDIWGTSDAFHFAYVPLSGDGQIVARIIENGSGSNSWAKGGVMIRETLDPDSKHAMMVVTGGSGGGKSFQYRETTGDQSYSAHEGQSASPPLWVKLERDVDTFTGYYSHDGVHWIEQPGYHNRHEIVMNHTVWVGLCVTSHAGGEVRTFMFDNVRTGLPLKAFDPSPSDGATFPDTWKRLRWSAGHTADSHDVYFGESYRDVDAGARGTFQGNQKETRFEVGLPGGAYPEGLVPGTTYYWRIDEVEKNGRTVHKGDIWSFSVSSLTAYHPYPADGARFVERGVVLQWTSGTGGVTHDVYFGENFDDVNNGVGGTYRGNQVATEFDILVLYPEGLVHGMEYFWRVDEVEEDGWPVYKGNVWSFTATLPGVGSIVQEKWNLIYGTHLNTLKNDKMYPQIPDETKLIDQFNTGTDLDDNYGGRVHGWLCIPLTGSYTFWLCTDDQGELWLSSGRQPDHSEMIAYVKDSPTAASGYADPYIWEKYDSQKSHPVLLKGGESYYITAIWKEGTGGDHCMVAWEGPGIPERTIIAGKYLSTEPVGAFPIPADGAKIGSRTPELRWAPREEGVTYDLYLSSNMNDVRYADVTSTSRIYRGRLLEAHYTTEQLNLGMTYYWRVDEVEADGLTVTKGDIWSFTIVDAMTLGVQVSSSGDDGYASNENLQNLSGEYLKVGDSKFSSLPYYVSGMVFRNLDIPRGAEIVSAHLKIRSYTNRLTDVVYGKIEAENAGDADGFGGAHSIGSMPVTSTSVNWDHLDPWKENTWYESPDIASVIQELIDGRGWRQGNSIALLYSARQSEGGYRNFSSFDRNADDAPKLEITFVP